MRLNIMVGCWAIALGAAAVAQGQAASGGVPGEVKASSAEAHSEGLTVSLLGRYGLLYAAKGQPYSLMETTTRANTLADGTTIRHVSQRRRLRDAAGRQRIEYGNTKDGAFEMNSVFVHDPARRLLLTIVPIGRFAQVCHYPAPRVPTPEEEATAADERKIGEDFQMLHSADPNTEMLPPETIAGFYVVGKRHTDVIPVGRDGNDREMRTVRETWTSPDLGIVVRETSDDPRSGRTTTEVTEFERADPDPALFQVPEGYKVIECDKSVSEGGSAAPTP